MYSLAPDVSMKRVPCSTRFGDSRNLETLHPSASPWSISDLERWIGRLNGWRKRIRRETGRWRCSTSNQPSTTCARINVLRRLSSASGFHDSQAADLVITHAGEDWRVLRGESSPPFTNEGWG